jgi:TolB-like protein/Tfp pilus assembly protein PilF
MDCYEGKSLKEKMAGGLMRIEEAADIAIQVAQGLQKAHEKGITHRDVKPGNIIITNDGVVKILDFGLAKLTGQSRLTKTGSTIGTAAYMSPEQAQGLEVDHQADIWSLGVVLFEMLTGKLPFRGEHEAALLYSVVHEEPQTVSSLRSDTPAQVERTIRKALEKEPARRYQTMQELIVDLKAAKSPAIELPNQEKSIVVLPFENLSPDSDQEYFSDGLTDEVISDLSNVRALRVISRSSAMTFKDTKKTIPEIARKLNVQYVLEGSVRKSGHNLRITVQLIDAANDANLWAEKYSGTLDDVFEIQEMVSRSIVDALQLKLLREENEKVIKRYTDNLEAYNLYLRGRWFWNKWTEMDIRKGTEYFESAIAIDPNYALAYAGLAEAYNTLAFYSSSPPRGILLKARELALKALSLDETLAEARTALGYVKVYYDWDWEDAEREFKKAIALKPDGVTAHHLYAYFLVIMNRYEEAFSEIRRALADDPLNLITNRTLGDFYYHAGQYDQAIDSLKKTIEMDPNFSYAHAYLGLSYLQKSMYPEALEQLQKESLLRDGNHPLFLAWLGVAYFKACLTEMGDDILNDLLERSRREYIPPYFFATLYFVKGEKDQGFEYMEKAFTERDSWLPMLTFDHFFDSVRSDSRFKDIIRRMNFPE